MMAIFGCRRPVELLFLQIVENTLKENVKEKGSGEESRTNFESMQGQNATRKRPEEVLKFNFQNFDDTNKQNGTRKRSDEVLNSTPPKFDSTNKKKGTEN